MSIEERQQIGIILQLVKTVKITAKKKVEPPTAATTQNAIGAIQGDSTD
jgi:hypothetical protein